MKKPKVEQNKRRKEYAKGMVRLQNYWDAYDARFKRFIASGGVFEVPKRLKIKIERGVVEMKVVNEYKLQAVTKDCEFYTLRDSLIVANPKS